MAPKPFYKVYVKPGDRARSGHNSFAEARQHAHRILDNRRSPASAYVVEKVGDEERNVYGVARTRSGQIVVGFDTHATVPPHRVQVAAEPRSRLSPLAERVAARVGHAFAPALEVA